MFLMDFIKIFIVVEMCRHAVLILLCTTDKTSLFLFVLALCKIWFATFPAQMVKLDTRFRYQIHIQDTFSCGLDWTFLPIDKNSSHPSQAQCESFKFTNVTKFISQPPRRNIRRGIFNWNKLQWLMRSGCKNGIPVSVWFNWTSRWEPGEGAHSSQPDGSCEAVMKDRLGLCRDNNQRRQTSPPLPGLWRAYLCCF